MDNYIKQIEDTLGSYKKLPNPPFYSDCNYVLYPALDGNFVDKILYDVLFDANKQIGNSSFIACAFLDIKGNQPSIITQAKKNWHEFESFQNRDLVYEGFYITGNNLDWLGIYHPDDYVIVGANNELTNIISKNLYGDSRWQTEFEKIYKSGRLDIYKEDYELIKSKLF